MWHIVSLLDRCGEAAKIRPFPLCQSLESFYAVEGKHTIAKAITRVASSVEEAGSILQSFCCCCPEKALEYVFVILCHSVNLSNKNRISRL